MANTALILANTGVGKTTSMRNLDPKSTFIVNPFGKELTWPGWRKQYPWFRPKEKKMGNMYEAHTTANICAALDLINKGENVKTVVVDDTQFIIAFKQVADMGRNGYDKFTEIVDEYIKLITKAKEMRDDITVFFMSHTDTDENGVSRCQLGGKMIEKIIGSLESLFRIVLAADISYELGDGDELKYHFRTRQGILDTVKTPMGMFTEDTIPNDLELVRQTMIKYDLGEE